MRMPSRTKYGSKVIITLLVGFVVLAAAFIYVRTFAIDDAGKNAEKEVSDMVWSINKLDDPTGSEVFIAISENADTDGKLSEAELAALRFEYKKYIEKRANTAGMKTNENNDIKGKQ